MCAHMKQSMLVVTKKKSHRTDSAATWEDRFSSVVVIAISLLFGFYVSVLATFPGLISDPSGQVTRTDVRYTEVTNKTNPLARFFASLESAYACEKHDDDYNGCVRAQVDGKGCSWYAGCRACIRGSHDGKSREDICR